MSFHVSNFVCEFQRRRILYERPLIGSARAAESAEDFYKPNTPIICAAHVVGIADPAMYRQCTGKRKYQSALKHTEDKPSKRTEVGDMDHATSGTGPSNEAGEPRGLKEKLIVQIHAIQADWRNAQATLAYEQAKFHADCAARNIRTTEDAERAWIRIAVARAEVVRPEV